MVATIETLADLCRQVGGDRIEVTSLSHGYQDPHFVEAKPSLVLTLNRADALVYVGLDLEIGWLPPLVQQSRNPRIQRGQPGNIDASTGIKVEDVPNIPADQLRALGDIHPLGNPHYWIPPKNARGIASVLAQRFAELDVRGRRPPTRPAWPRSSTASTPRRRPGTRPRRRCTACTWSPITRAGRTWPSGSRCKEVGYIEPKPGIPPTANHTAQLIELMRKSNVKLVIVESFYPSSLARFVAENGHARLASAPSDVGAAPGIKTYFDLVDAVIAAFVGGQ